MRKLPIMIVALIGVSLLFWFVLLGLPGAAAYRFANTADAMWGYRGLRGGRYWEWAGKWAAAR